MVTANRTTDVLTGPPLHRAGHSPLVIGSQVITQPNVSLFAAGVQQRTFLSDVHSTILKEMGSGHQPTRSGLHGGTVVSNIGGSVNGHPQLYAHISMPQSSVIPEVASGHYVVGL
jgi:hypothetical protein